MNWKKRNQKAKRKDKRKKPDPIRDARRFIEAGASIERLSYCDEHGIYSPDLLCACYNKGGIYEGMDYNTVTNKLDMTTIQVGYCPIHGSYTEDDLCACHDENGNLKKDWNKGVQ